MVNKFKIFFSNLIISQKYNRKIDKLIGGLECVYKNHKTGLIGIDYFDKNNNKKWHNYYISLNNINSDYYISEDFYYTRLEGKLNDRAYSRVYSDKYLLYLLVDRAFTINDVFFYINGEVVDKNGFVVTHDTFLSYITSFEETVIKPIVDSGGGRSILFCTSDEIVARFDELLKTGNYVIQKYLKQNDCLGKFNPESLNTIRVLTLRLGSDIVVLSAFLRMGTLGSRLDNITRGGCACGVDLENGCLKRFGIESVKSKLIVKHPSSGVEFFGTRIPSWDEVKDVVITSHKRLLNVNLISWDIAIDNSLRPRVVELNTLNQEINTHQILNGPIFKSYINYYHENN